MIVCSPQLGISPKSVLGGEICDREILKHLAMRGIEVEICLPLFKAHESQAYWRITRVPVPFVVPPHLYNLIVLPYLFYLYKKRPFDILRIHSPTFIGIAGVIFKKFHPEVKLVSFYHWLGEGGALEKYINPPLLAASDGIFCDSNSMRNKIIADYKISKNKVYAVHNGVEKIIHAKVRNEAWRKKFDIQPKDVVLLFVGLYIDRKNPLFLLKLMKRLIKKHSNVKLIYCGKGPLREKLKLSIADMGLQKHVFVTDPVHAKEKNELFNSADIFVHPAKLEGFSLAVIEAMACGLPVVMTQAYSASEAVENRKNGFLCRTPKEWEASLNLLLTDASLRKTMRQANIRKVNASFRWDVVAKQYDLIFQQLLGKRSHKN